MLIISGSLMLLAFIGYIFASIGFFGGYDSSSEYYDYYDGGGYYDNYDGDGYYDYYGSSGSSFDETLGTACLISSFVYLLTGIFGIIGGVKAKKGESKGFVYFAAILNMIVGMTAYLIGGIFGLLGLIFWTQYWRGRREEERLQAEMQRFRIMQTQQSAQSNPPPKLPTPSPPPVSASSKGVDWGHQAPSSRVQEPEWSDDAGDSRGRGLPRIRNIYIAPRPPSNEVKSSIANAIPGYRITHKLGSGGFATVYKAEDERRRWVAIKMPKFIDETLDASIYEKFESEANMWKNLQHKNIVEFHEYVLDPIPCLVMELMEGGSLKDLLDNRRLSTQEALSIFIQLVDAISYAHRMASVHRDIKPENVLFTRDGIPKLTDWGIGKLMAAESATKTVGAKGTLAYSAPEQISRKKFGKVDWSTDIFQIAVVGYEMLTGTNPFHEDDPVGIMGKIINEDVTAPSRLNPEVSPRVDTIIVRALEKRKEDRWRSADIMYDRLKAAGGY